ncbi:hypothetical protein FKM82_019445 [Ascaphus truei]
MYTCSLQLIILFNSCEFLDFRVTQLYSLRMASMAHLACLYCTVVPCICQMSPHVNRSHTNRSICAHQCYLAFGQNSVWNGCAQQLC